MLSSALLVIFSVFGSLSLAAPQFDDQPTPSPIPQDEPIEAAPSHLDKTWEIVIAVVFSVLVSAVIVIAIWVKLRRRHRRHLEEAKLRLSSARATSPYRRSTAYTLSSSTSQVAKEDAVAAPLPVLSYSERSARFSPSPSITPPPASHARSGH